MATRVGLLDADSDVSDDDDTPLGVAGARRLAKRVDGDDFMDEDARDDAIVDLYDSRATAEALRAHEDALEALRARQTSTADAFGAFLSVDDGENEARALATDSNEARGDAVARPRPPPMARKRRCDRNARLAGQSTEHLSPKVFGFPTPSAQIPLGGGLKEGVLRSPERSARRSAPVLSVKC